MNTALWALQLDPPSADPLRVLGGLPLVLRLALEAQRAGAAALVVPPTSDIPRSALADPRLTLPVLDEAPEAHAVLRLPANLLVHRSAFDRMRQGDGSDPAAPDPYGFDPVAVTDAVTARRGERALFRSLRKTQDGWTARWLNRHLSLALSRLLVRTPLHPNHVSIAILIIGLAGAYLASRGTYWSLLLGAFLFQMQSILDGCDGEMSRVTFRGSHLGEWLDTVGDDLTNYGFFAGAAWGLYQTTGDATYAAAGAVTIGAGVSASAIEYRYLLRIGSGDLLKYPIHGSSASGLLSWIAPLFKRDTFVLLTFLAAAAGQVGPMLLVFAVGAVLVLVQVLLAEARRARARALDRSGAEGAP